MYGVATGVARLGQWIRKRLQVRRKYEPVLHLCDTQYVWFSSCRWLCRVGYHRRETPNAACGCCGHKDYATERERAMTSGYPSLKLRWWK